MAQPVKISGLVTAANRVREQLTIGIPNTEVDQFRRHVQQTLQTVEKICAASDQCPSQLPTPSRKAYIYLKQINLNQLPTLDQAVSVQSTVRISQIRSHTKHIQTKLSQAAQQADSLANTHTQLLRLINRKVSDIEDLCQRAGGTPAHLTGEAKPFYAWLSFLREGHHLQYHLDALHQLYTLAKSTDKVPTPLNIEFGNIKRLYSYHSKNQQLSIHEGYIAADADVFAALLTVLVNGKSSKAGTAIRKFSLSEEFSEIALAMDLKVGTLVDKAKGQHYDLSQIFAKVNQDYFQSALGQPQLAWSPTYTRRKFGHYETARDRVVLSRTLDDATVPAYVVEFVMYHELLHKKHGETWVNGRQMVHTPAFRNDEQQFQQYELAQKTLQKLASH